MHRPLLRSTVLASAIVALGCSNDGSEFDSDPPIVCTDQVGCPEGSRCVQGQFCETVQPIEPGSGTAVAPRVVVVIGPGGGSLDAGIGGRDDGGFEPGDAGLFGGCPEGQLVCNGVCADAQSDPTNCGACGIACTGVALCQQGVCCDPIGSVCGDVCADLTRDRNNCGTCGLVCPMGTECTLGVCREILPGTMPSPGFGD